MIRYAPFRYLRALPLPEARACSVVILILSLCGLLSAQSSPSALPAVTFTLDFPSSDPPHYSIVVESNGNATYDSAVKVEDDPEQQSYHSQFDVTTATRDRIFDLARQAKYFSGKIDSGNRKLAFTGNKTLSYHDDKQSSTAEYNFSSSEPVRQLTALFQGIASTQDFGRRLAYYHHYQKLALDDELKRMEAQAKGNQLAEIQGVVSVLQAILHDASVINVVRARAKELIQMGNAPAAGR